MELSSGFTHIVSLHGQDDFLTDTVLLVQIVGLDREWNTATAVTDVNGPVDVVADVIGSHPAVDNLVLGHGVHIIGVVLPMLGLELGNGHIGDSISNRDENWRLVKLFMTRSHENQHE